MSTSLTDKEHHDAFVVNRQRWLHAPTLYDCRLYDAYTHEQIKGSGGRTPDGNYEMLPDNTLVLCNLEDTSGNSQSIQNVYARICDQKEFFDMILYCVEYPIGSGKMAYTRATNIKWPLPNMEFKTLAPSKMKEICCQINDCRKKEDLEHLSKAPSPTIKEEKEE